MIQDLFHLSPDGLHDVAQLPCNLQEHLLGCERRIVARPAHKVWKIKLNWRSNLPEMTLNVLAVIVVLPDTWGMRHYAKLLQALVVVRFWWIWADGERWELCLVLLNYRRSIQSPFLVSYPIPM